MIFTRLFDLQQYVESEIGVPCAIGDPDIGSDEKPFIKLIMDEEFALFYQNQKLEVLDLPVTIKIIVDKGNEQKALEVLDRLLQKINQFFFYEGHTLEGTGTPEYVDETKTFEVNILYNLKLLPHDTN